MKTPNDELNPHTWLNEHGNYLYSYALSSVKDQHIAEDLVQETLLAALTAKNSFSHQSTVRTWLIGILKHKLIDYYRKQGRYVALEDLADDGDNFLDNFFRTHSSWKDKPEVFPNPESVFQQKQFWTIFQNCLSGLKPRYAEVFLAKEIHGMSNDEICKCFSLTPTNGWVLLHRARLSLIKCLKTNWID
ncbi:MAG: sigma-70 family RNA polymerase sigma factor [Burkholderiales bacterium]|nr:sigma-70 family RNA polymerase sigma factor [Calditrichota bacterium]MCP5246301.1 sigma-70 family RNA polymerase sigma factor [Burkholderiales bacterium]MDR4517999.1 sigma-70 family RNA polymerase sigma factor [Nitrosomonas sp.]